MVRLDNWFDNFNSNSYSENINLHSYGWELSYTKLKALDSYNFEAYNLLHELLKLTDYTSNDFYICLYEQEVFTNGIDISDGYSQYLQVVIKNVRFNSLVYFDVDFPLISDKYEITLDLDYFDSFVTSDLHSIKSKLDGILL